VRLLLGRTEGLAQRPERIALARPRTSAERIACTKAICHYIHDTYGRFTGGTDAMRLMWVDAGSSHQYQLLRQVLRPW